MIMVEAGGNRAIAARAASVVEKFNLAVALVTA
jgi:hypothetical protein